MADELDLSKLATPGLIEQMQDDLYDGLADEVAAGTKELLARGLKP